jgi:hypothetical protein
VNRSVRRTLFTQPRMVNCWAGKVGRGGVAIVLCVSSSAPVIARPPLDRDLERLLRATAPSSFQKYRLPEPADLIGDWESHPGAYRVRGDFDGDGRDDTAVLLIRRQGPGFQLVVVLGSQSDAPVAVVLEKRPWLAQHFGLGVVPPGRYKTAAGKGFKVSADDPAEITLDHAAIDRFEFESWNAFWYWDSNKHRFRYTQMSD